MTKVLSTKEFDAWEKLLPKEYQERIQKIINKLKDSQDIGKPLGYLFFREAKLGKYRLYFLIYEDIQTVLLITLSDKKAQQETIDRIKNELEFYNDLIRKGL
ncbi:type II toxin-antitoxin system RelE/ParE family toxin [Candidatus Woesearchaeota archaeon]|nr:type II toxin-antitoxin system RelE/ParE family toxin [Candidatus Woesearchaeota archaeon]